MTLNVVCKINTCLKFLYREGKFLSPQLRRLLRNALIQSHFDYACSVWYPNLQKKSKQSCKLFKASVYVSAFNQTIKPRVGISEFKQINWLPVNYRFRQCLAAKVFKFFDKCPLYMKDVFDKSCVNQASTRNSTMKLSQPLRRTKIGQHCIFFLAPSVWNKLPNEVNRCTNLNTFKHKIKEYFLYKIRQKDNDVCLYDQTLVLDMFINMRQLNQFGRETFLSI